MLLANLCTTSSSNSTLSNQIIAPRFAQMFLQGQHARYSNGNLTGSLPVDAGSIPAFALGTPQ